MSGYVRILPDYQSRANTSKFLIVIGWKTILDSKFMHINRLFTPLCLFLFLLIYCHSAFADSFSFVGKVVGVSDGDTIKVMHDGQPEKIRLWGIDCPEKTQAFGQKAKQKTSELAFGKLVTVHKKDTDRYGRTVGEVILPDGSSLNKELARAGYAWWYRRYDPHDHAFEKLESSAKTQKLGLWADPNALPPWEYRHNKANETQLAGQPSRGIIIGNWNSHVYHLPGCPGYAATNPKNRAYFQTEEEAQQAGFRKAGNCK